ncbi:hypothetical protein [Spiroplasma turonicum]|uniref:Transmembrane protein n=1 Tax=Spiroplasma turonicum TaxID=216946 RepID=A0A0K1P5K5_9MOLU|nr:hypothetical protein [Spiroplasma turonicum]AKU79578.1 hypothetical protein STURON_00332 [Spiroplasma turonicum]ALX70600.1 hypothetical protein STURO_v1c03320 [Spiroplasma turonicum]
MFSIFTSLFSKLKCSISTVFISLIISFSPLITSILSKVENNFSGFNEFYQNDKLIKFNFKTDITNKAVKYINDESLKDFTPIADILDYKLKEGETSTNRLSAFKRALYLGQLNLLNINNKSVIEDWKIYKTIFDPIYKSSLRYYNLFTNPKSDYDFNFFLNLKTVDQVNLINFSGYINYLKSLDELKTLSPLLEYIKTIFNDYWWSLSNQRVINSQFASIYEHIFVEDSRMMFFNESDDDSEEYLYESNEKIFNLYNELPQLMILNYLIMQLYTNMIYFDDQIFFNILSIDILSNDNEDITIEELLNSYELYYKKLDYKYNLNFLGNFSTIYLNLNKNLLYKEIIYNNANANFMWFLPRTRVSSNFIRDLINNSKNNIENKKATPIFSEDIHFKGSSNYIIIIISWLLFDLLLTISSYYIFKIKILK